ncbi:tagaturonate epimerase family protein, partial [Christensenellaceae bacterium OttesenSCG-928-L17]|nr:tagaturonate epimerase family protein [Christensenellaceae bacterium OttesenSCG-928-L17]
MNKLEDFIPGVTQNEEQYGIYPKSMHATAKGEHVFMVRQNEKDFLVAPIGTGFQGETFLNAQGGEFVLAPLTHENAQVLRTLFPFTAPVQVLEQARTVGVGDRLGIACPGHIRVFEQYDAFPVFAQQSIRELTLTNRTYNDVLDCVTFSVFREDYTRGFGADGDHLKTPEEVDYALSCGYTMITLDCSEHIRNDISAMSDEEVRAAYVHNDELEKLYLNQCFILEE